jgi:hypothetical protein
MLYEAKAFLDVAAEEQLKGALKSFPPFLVKLCEE